MSPQAWQGLITGVFAMIVVVIQFMISGKQNKKIEEVKSEFGILTQRKISISSEMQATLIDYISKYNAWLNFMLNVYILPKSDPPNIDTEKILEKLHEMYYQVLISDVKLEVYHIKNRPLIDLKTTIKSQTIGIYINLQKKLNELKHQRESTIYTEKLSDLMPNKITRIQEEYAKEVIIFNEYQDENLRIYNNIAPLIYDFKLMINDSINNV